MTGLEHFKEAEQLLQQGKELDIQDAPATLAAAQVHATLALAAATALGLDAPPGEYDAWQKVCGVKRT